MNYYSSDYFNKLCNIALDYTSKNYDLSYLTAMHEKISTEGANTPKRLTDIPLDSISS